MYRKDDSSMLFDKLCGVAERHIPFLIPTLRRAKIFKFEGVPHEILDKMLDDRSDDEIKDLYNGFHLPYPVIAIEDGASCVILEDTLDDQMGFDNYRLVTELIDVNADNKYFNDDVSVAERKQGLIKAYTGGREPSLKYTIVFGKARISLITRKDDYIVGNKDLYNGEYYHGPGSDDNDVGLITDAGIRSAVGVTKNGLIDTWKHCSDIVKDQILKSFSQNALASFSEIMYIQSPSRFILKSTPLNIKNKKKSKKIPRSHQRPMYTVLKPEEIREKLNITHSHGTGGSRTVRVHERRRHWRYLSDDYYAYDKNGDRLPPLIIPTGKRRGEIYYKKTYVPATWVGKSEAVVGNKRYKVVLDR